MKLSEIGGDTAGKPPAPVSEPPPAPKMRLSETSSPEDTAPSRARLSAPPSEHIDREAAFNERKMLEQQGKGRGDPEWEALTRKLGEAQRQRTGEVLAFAPFGAPLTGGGAASVVRRVGDAVSKAREAGYVLPPRMTGAAGTLYRMLEGYGGKVKVEQLASELNQPVTNALAAKSLGLPEDTTLTSQVLNTVREKAGQAYEGVAHAMSEIRQDGLFKKAIGELDATATEAGKYFPDLVVNPKITELLEQLKSVEAFSPRAGLDLVKKLRADAASNLKAIGDPLKNALGLAQRKVASAVDDLMERNIDKAGKGPIVENYRKARQQIAKAYDIESVTNTATGDVSALGLARLLDNGKPLTDQLKTIADAANSFSKAFRDVASFGGTETWSVGDIIGSGIAMKTGAKEIAGALMARPLARRTILSKPAQNALTKPKVSVQSPRIMAISPAANLADRVAESEDQDISGGRQHRRVGERENSPLSNESSSSSQPYPTSQEAQEKINTGMGYGSGFETSLGPGARAVDATGIKGSEDQVIRQIAKRMAQDNPDAADVFMRGAVAANRSAISGLGFDPYKVAISRGADKRNIGMYDPDRDVIWMDSEDPSTIVHESIHRGLEILRKSKALTKSERELIDKSEDSEEFVVRFLMYHTMGDPEGKLGPHDKAEREQGIKMFSQGKNAQKNLEILNSIEEKAARLIAKRRQYGPH